MWQNINRSQIKINKNKVHLTTCCLDKTDPLHLHWSWNLCPFFWRVSQKWPTSFPLVVRLLHEALLVFCWLNIRAYSLGKVTRLVVSTSTSWGTEDGHSSKKFLHCYMPTTKPEKEVSWIQKSLPTWLPSHNFTSHYLTDNRRSLRPSVFMYEHW